MYEGEPETTPPLATSEQTVNHDAAGHDHSAEEWGPEDGFERIAFTLLANVLTAIGFALIVLVAMMASTKLARNVDGFRFDWRYGLIWGGAGYLVFWLAPAIGLPPEIPGATAAALETRQLWWIFAVVCTASGLAGLAFGKSWWRWAALLLVVVPHLVGAPHHDGEMFAGQTADAASALEILAHRFIGATAIANAVLWLVLGLASTWSVKRIITAREQSPVEFNSTSV